MKNRKFLSPIVVAASLSLVGSSIVSAQTSQASSASSAEEPAVTILQPLGPASVVAEGAASSAHADAPAPFAPKELPPHTANYTVVKGDTLTKLAVKFNSTRKKLQDLNTLTDGKLAPGQVILVPWYKKTPPMVATVPMVKPPVAVKPSSILDTPGETAASTPVPTTTETKGTSTEDYSHAPIAKLVSPAELDAEMKKQKRVAALAAAAANAPLTPHLAPTGAIYAPGTQKPVATTATPQNSTPNSFNARPMLNTTKLTTRTYGTPAVREMSMPYTEWGTRFIQEARALGDQGLNYDDDWRPPGENRSWVMDCSNTTRYLYKITAGISLPRTASDQYYYLHLQGKAWDLPQTATSEYLRQNLKPGDLLFWENTYRPERQPPITHVMIFLGTNDKGQWIMAGSQCSRGGEHNRRNGGPDIYVFRPWEPCGGYTTWLGMVHHQGHFVAFGRPLEADRSKLAANE